MNSSITTSNAAQKSTEALEHFIPIRAAQLVRLMANQRCLTAAQVHSFQVMTDLVFRLYNRQTIAQLEDHLEDYAPFDPDQDLVYQRKEGASLRALRGERFAQQVQELLRTANYIPLSQEALDQSLELAAGWGVRYAVDFSTFNLLRVAVRGVQRQQVQRRNWWCPWRKESRWISVFQRVVLIFRVKPDRRLGQHFDPDCIYLKIFKDMPETEVDMMMPGSRVKFSWKDRGKIFLPAIGGIFTGVRLAKALVIWGPRISLFIRFVALTSILKWIGGSSWFTDWAMNSEGDGLNFTGWAVAGVLACTFYIVKYYLSHNRTSREHQSLLTTNLYMRNLGNNAAVLFQIIEDAKEQEVRELLLGYFLLWQHAGPEGWTAEQLDVQAQAFLRQHLKREIDFEVSDALRKLVEHKMAFKNMDGRWVAEDIDRIINKIRHQLHG